MSHQCKDTISVVGTGWKLLHNSWKSTFVMGLTNQNIPLVIAVTAMDLPDGRKQITLHQRKVERV